MRIALEGRRAVLLGEGGAVAAAIEASLTACGARVEREGAPGAWLLVQVSGGVEGEGDAGEAERFAAAARAFAPEAGRIVNVISAAGLVPLKGAAERSARQAALASLTRALAMELAPATLVNALAVGCEARMASHAALGRAGTAEEAARAALFLADPANSYTTGHVMAVDGGWSIGYARDF